VTSQNVTNLPFDTTKLAFWHVRDAFIDLRAFWREVQQDPDGKRSIVTQVVQSYPTSVAVALPAVAEADIVNDMIGACFDAVLSAQVRDAPDARWQRWDQGLGDLDARVHVNTALALATPDTYFPVFGAGD
jgi:hypothetical protein